MAQRTGKKHSRCRLAKGIYDSLAIRRGDLWAEGAKTVDCFGSGPAVCVSENHDIAAQLSDKLYYVTFQSRNTTWIICHPPPHRRTSFESIPPCSLSIIPITSCTLITHTATHYCSLAHPLAFHQTFTISLLDSSIPRTRTPEGFPKPQHPHLFPRHTVILDVYLVGVCLHLPSAFPPPTYAPQHAPPVHPSCAPPITPLPRVTLPAKSSCHATVFAPRHSLPLQGRHST